jgi:hypothetical protein
MPEYTFDGPPGTTYPSSKDSAGVAVGTVEPGEIRDLDEPLDHWWRASDGEAAASPEASASPAATPPALPQAAPPAQIFPQPASTATQEG